MGQVVINGVRTMHVQNYYLWALRGQRLIRARPKEIEELQGTDVGDEESKRERRRWICSGHGWGQYGWIRRSGSEQRTQNKDTEDKSGSLTF